MNDIPTMSQFATELDCLRAREAYLLAKVEELQQQNAFLIEQLNNASDSVQEWGNYADQYFQEKWNLAGDVQKYKDAANPAPIQPIAQLEVSHKANIDRIAEIREAVKEVRRTYDIFAKMNNE